jgi:carbamoyl-phosphate synthase large subunit
VDAIDRAEDRERFAEVCRIIGATVPDNGVATSEVDAIEVARKVGGWSPKDRRYQHPVLVRPSYVLGGRAMEIIYDEESLKEYFERAVRVSAARPVLIDRFIEDAFEADVDALSDGTDVVIGGIMQHIENAGVHSGDSACVLPAPSVSPALEDEIGELVGRLVPRLGARGLLNLQLALHGGELYVLEANPRASRTVPFVAKALDVPLVDHACRLLLGEPLDALGLPERVRPKRAWAKEAVFPSDRFAGAADRGVEMRSTGEVMASGEDVAAAYRRVLRAAGRARAAGGVQPLQAR